MVSANLGIWSPKIVKSVSRNLGIWGPIFAKLEQIRKNGADYSFTTLNNTWVYNGSCNGDSSLSLLEELDPQTVARGEKLEIKNYHFRTSRGNLCPNLCIWGPKICAFEGDFGRFSGHQISGASRGLLVSSATSLLCACIALSLLLAGLSMVFLRNKSHPASIEFA